MPPNAGVSLRRSLSSPRREPMTSGSLYDSRPFVLFERLMVALTFMLFSYHALAWQGLVGGEPPWRPLQSMLVIGSLLLQSVTALAQRRYGWRWLSWTLLGASVLLLGLAIVAR
jgi:hypothetical protein